MHYQGNFDVPAARDAAYAFLIEPKNLVSIFPDAHDLRIIDENNFSAKVKVGMSFIKGTLDVKMTLVEKKPSSFAKLKARGTGMNSSVDLESAFSLEDGRSSGTTIAWTADTKISGMMASVGSRLMESAAEKYVNQIVDSLKRKLAQ